MKAWQTLESQTAFENPWLSIQKSRVQTGKGLIIDDFYTVSISEAACVVAIDNKNRILLKEEYRYCVDRTMLEIPAGMIESTDTDALSAMRRELLEETGYTSDHWTELGESIPETSKLTNRLRIFLARDCEKVSEPKLDPSEDITVHVLPFSDAIDKVISGEITGSITAHALLLAGRKLHLL